jgi:hypothetical protein
MSSPSSTPPPPAPEPPSTPSEQTDFNIGEEYGTARKSLPPAGIVAICLVVVVVIATLWALTHRAHAQATGSIDDVVSVPMPGEDMVMVAINVSIQNSGEKPSWIHTIQVTTEAGGNTLTDDAAPAVDVQRYFQAFPDLKQHALNVLTTEARMNPGTKIAGTIVVSFPVKADVFAARKSLTVTITPYDELPLVLKI